MRGLMMDYPLSIPADPAPRRDAVRSRNGGRPPSRPEYRRGRHMRRSSTGFARSGAALQELGVEPGDRVATLGCASQEHLEAYLAIPSIGAVLHTLNLRLHQDDLTYIVNDAEDRVIIVDEALLPLYEKFKQQVDDRARHRDTSAKARTTTATPQA